MIPFDKSSVPPELVTDTYLAAMTACMESRWAEAIVLFEQEPKGSPCYGLALGNKGQALLSLERYREAEVCLRQALDSDCADKCPHAPSQVQFRRNLAEAVGRQGRWAESFPFFEAAAKHADELLEKCQEEQEALLLQKAHVFNAWGNSHLNLHLWQEAVDRYGESREIYRQLPARVREGYPETLTNLALALTKQDDLTRANFAATEALEAATMVGDEDQAYRVKIAAIQMGSTLVRIEERAKTLLAAAEHSAALGRLSTAYLRFCIGADQAENADAHEEGLDFVGRARAIEDQLDPLDPHIAMLRGTEARLLRRAETSDVEILPVLLDGARRWYELLAQPIVTADFGHLSRSMHNHFRMLTRHLLNLGRVDEALAAFEAGRSLLHYRQIDRVFADALIRNNPFTQPYGQVSLDNLRNAQQSLRDGECAVVLAVVPPQLVIFVAWNDRVEVVANPWPTTLDEGNALMQETEMVPHRLAEKVGKRAIPQVYVDCARDVAGIIGESLIRSLTPYSILHTVPWRALLRDSGAPWAKLPFTTVFGFLLRIATPAMPSLSGMPVVSLGHGTAGSINLEEEARRFAEAFGTVGELSTTCRPKDVLLALQQDEVVLISCHGKSEETEAGPSTTFDLADDSGATIRVRAEDMIPSSVACPLVILSACESGVYEVQWGEYPVGVAPQLIQLGARRCIGSRFVLSAAFARMFFPALGQQLAAGHSIEEAFSACLTQAEADGYDLWRDLACLELLGDG